MPCQPKKEITILEVVAQSVIFGLISFLVNTVLNAIFFSDTKKLLTIYWIGANINIALVVTLLLSHFYHLKLVWRKNKDDNQPPV